MQMRKYMQGITLMELMIVIVIIGILTAIAFPNYREFVARAKRTEAKSELLRIAADQEKFYLQNQRFGTLSELGYSGDTISSETDTYSITAVADPAWAQGFLATATYERDDGEGDKCKTFTINGGGTKGSGPYTDCWTRKN